MTISLNGQVNLVEDLIACYPLDGDTYDISGNCLHGENFGAESAKCRNGVMGKALRFDGLDDFIEVPHSELFNFSNDQDFSISLWLLLEGQADLDTTDNDVISKWVIDDNSTKHLMTGYPYTLRVINKKNRRQSFFYWAQFGGYTPACKSDVDPHSKNPIVKQEYIHVCLTVRRNRFYFYINGELERMEGSSVHCDPSNNAPLRFGKRGGIKHQNLFKGVLDDIAIWDRALTQAEVKLLAKSTFKLNEYVMNAKRTDELVLEETLLFETDDWTLSKPQKKKIKRFLKYMDDKGTYHLSIEGHTNNLCEKVFCDELSQKRSNVVRDYLVAEGYNCDGIFSLGFGKKKQVASNKDLSRRKLNQRVELYLYKTK